MLHPVVLQDVGFLPPRAQNAPGASALLQTYLRLPCNKAHCFTALLIVLVYFKGPTRHVSGTEVKLSISIYFVKLPLPFC